MRTLRDMSRGHFRVGNPSGLQPCEGLESRLRRPYEGLESRLRHPYEGLLRLALAATPLLVAGLLSAPAVAADDGTGPVTCEQTPAESAAVQQPNVLDPTLRGVGLEDLDDDAADMVAGYLRLKGVLPLSEVLATAVVEQRLDRFTVDVVGRAFRFDDTDSLKNKHGRVGVMRVEVPIFMSEGLCDVGEPEVVWQRSLTDLDLHYRVSISDWVGVIDDPLSGFRRVFPLGGGGIDNGVRYPGIVSSMTPTTDDGLLEKDYAWRELGSPWYFRKKPYLPISLGRSFKRADGSYWKTYLESNIAFHIWQDKGFERGNFSHGCMRLRTADLAELAAYVFGARAPIPVKLKLDPITDARHPFPFDRVKYWQLKNYGTAEKPRFRMKYMLHEMELGSLPLPLVDQFTPMTFDSKPILDTRAADSSKP